MLLIVITGATVIKHMTISLAVGASTIALLQFFYAISDGVIDPVERRMMGVGYLVLRIAMVLLLFSSLTLAVQGIQTQGWQYFTPIILHTWVILTVVYLNAIAMTRHWIPITWGPAIQASSLYSLGITAAFTSSEIGEFSYLGLFTGYAMMFLLALAAINVTLHLLKQRLQRNQICNNP